MLAAEIGIKFDISELKETFRNQFVLLEWAPSTWFGRNSISILPVMSHGVFYQDGSSPSPIFASGTAATSRAGSCPGFSSFSSGDLLSSSTHTGASCDHSRPSQVRRLSLGVYVFAFERSGSALGLAAPILCGPPRVLFLHSGGGTRALF